jgi:hypothetical protein
MEDYIKYARQEREQLADFLAALSGRREPFGYVDPDTLEFKHSKDEHRRGATVWPVYLRETE